MHQTRAEYNERKGHDTDRRTTCSVVQTDPTADRSTAFLQLAGRIRPTAGSLAMPVQGVYGIAAQFGWLMMLDTRILGSWAR